MKPAKNPKVKIGDIVRVLKMHPADCGKSADMIGKVCKVRGYYGDENTEKPSFCARNEILVEGCGIYIWEWEMAENVVKKEKTAKKLELAAKIIREGLEWEFRWVSCNEWMRAGEHHNILDFLKEDAEGVKGSDCEEYEIRIYEMH